AALMSGNRVAGGSGVTASRFSTSKHGRAAGPGIFLHGNGSFTLASGTNQLQILSDAIVDQAGVDGSGGSWALIKNGLGVTILEGENAYTGGTIVNGGALVVTTLSLRGNVAINHLATVTFDQPGNGFYHGNISGTGTLLKEGAGRVTLAG